MAILPIGDPGSLETILFDVDGTLLDSNGAHAETWTQALREHGISVAVTRIRSLIGMGSDKLLPEVAKVADDSTRGHAIASRKAALFAERLPTLKPTRGARDLVAFLCDQGLSLVVATSASDDEVHALLAQSRVDDLIPTRATKDDAAGSKPDPDIVRAALARAKARAETALMVGDTPYDIEAASRAGVRAMAFRCGGYWSDEALRGSIGIFDDPAAALAQLRDAFRSGRSGHVAGRSSSQ